MTRSRRIFSILLFLYPKAYRDEFGGEMLELFELRMMASESPTRLLIREMAGLIAGAARERLTSRSERPSTAMGDFDARHFPKAVVAARMRVDSAVQKMVFAIAHHQFAEARRLANEERVERENLRRLCENYGIDAM